MVKKCLIHAILIVYENTHEIYKHCVEVDLDGGGVAKNYQVHLWHKNTAKCDHIRLIQACILLDYYKIFSKRQEIMAIHHQPL